MARTANKLANRAATLRKNTARAATWCFSTARRTKKAIKVEANLTLFGLLMGEEGKPLHAWYQCDGEQFVLCQSSHWQKLRYLGIAHEVNGQQGAWLSAENTAGKKRWATYLPWSRIN